MIQIACAIANQMADDSIFSRFQMPNLTDVGCFSLKAWPPYVAGMLIGGLQVPLTVFAGDTLGGSSSYGAVVAQFMRGPLRDVCPFLNKMKTGLGWQVGNFSPVSCIPGRTQMSWCFGRIVFDLNIYLKKKSSCHNSLKVQNYFAKYLVKYWSEPKQQHFF